MPSRRPLTGREVWRIGDWGGASNLIGRRWESVGAAAVTNLVGRPSPTRPDFVPDRCLSFILDQAHEQALQSAGYSHPDVLLAGPLDRQTALQPVDFKWSLEVADLVQVTPEPLERLLGAEEPAVVAARGAAFGPDGLPEPEQRVLLDGFFVAPEHRANHAFLASQRNLTAERPMAAGDVVFVAVDGRAFFRVLTGWELAEHLAAREGAGRMLDTLEGAEHYYRLGAGVQGALGSRRRSIFSDVTPEFDPIGDLAELRRGQRLSTLGDVVAYLDRALTARQELRKTANGIGRLAYAFAAFRADLQTRGIVLPPRGAPDPGGVEKAWTRLYGLVQQELGLRIKTEGLRLVQAGQSDAQAVATLQQRAPELGQAARRRASALIEAQLRPGGSPG